MSKGEVECNNIPAAISVALLDDNKYMLLGMKAELSRERDIEVVYASENPNEFVNFVIENEPDVSCIDLNIEGDSNGGFNVIEALQNSEVSTKCMIHTLGDDASNLIYARNLNVMVLAIVMERPETRGQQPQLADLIRKTYRGEHYFPLHLLDEALEIGAPGKVSTSSEISFSSSEGMTEKAKLTDTELEVLMLIGQRLSNKEISQSSFKAESTVKTHVSNILRKLKAKDREQAYLLAVSQGLFEKS